jgi:hypothetical protein
MRIRRFVTWAAVTVTALAAVLSGAEPAAAGGPTSVMLVSPGSGKAGALYISSPEYQLLDESIGRGPGRSAPPSLADVMNGEQRQITVSWLIHDVSVYRVDYVYPDAAGGPWVHSRDATASGLPEKGVWHKAAQPKVLDSLLDRMGLMGPDKSLSMSAPDYPLGLEDSGTEAPDTATDPATATPQAAAAGDAGGPADWWLSLTGLGVGLAVGSAGTVLALRLISRRAPREPGPRQELVDA